MLWQECSPCILHLIGIGSREMTRVLSMLSMCRFALSSIKLIGSTIGASADSARQPEDSIPRPDFRQSNSRLSHRRKCVWRSPPAFSYLFISHQNSSEHLSRRILLDFRCALHRFNMSMDFEMDFEWILNDSIRFQ